MQRSWRWDFGLWLLAKGATSRAEYSKIIRSILGSAHFFSIKILFKFDVETTSEKLEFHLEEGK